MTAKRVTLVYLITYLAFGGIGLAFFPKFILELFFSTGEYGEIMPRVAGMFMMVLSYLIFRILKNNDWQYYLPTIQVRSGIVVFLFWLYYKSQDPLFLVLNVVVLVGLLPSIIFYIRDGKLS